MFGETSDGLRRQELVDRGVLGRILWRDMDSRRLGLALELAALGMRAESPDLQASGEAGGGRGPAPRPAVSLSEQQRAVLAGLRAGRRQAEIAREQHLSLRTIEGLARDLRTRFDAATTGELIDKARDLDLEGHQSGR